MKQKFTNLTAIRGYVFSHTLQERVRDDHSRYIVGVVNVATDDDAINVVPVNFIVNEKTKKGGTNSTFENLKQIIDSGVTYEIAKTDANKVRIDGAIDVNDFYNRNGELVTSKRVHGSFLHFLGANEPIVTEKSPAAYFEADVLLQAAVQKESNDGSEYLSLQGFAFNYRGNVLPVTFSISSPDGMAFFEGEDISASNPYFGTVFGSINSTVVVSERETDDTQVAFGQRAVQETSRTFRTWEVIGANVNSGLDESTITQEELVKAVQEREQRLAELKAKNDERTQTGFPVAAATPASDVPPFAANSNDDDEVF